MSRFMFKLCTGIRVIMRAIRTLKLDCEPMCRARIRCSINKLLDTCKTYYLYPGMSGIERRNILHSGIGHETEEGYPM
jgi:hypothetical protein